MQLIQVEQSEYHYHYEFENEYYKVTILSNSTYSATTEDTSV